MTVQGPECQVLVLRVLSPRSQLPQKWLVNLTEQDTQLTDKLKH